MSVPGGSLWREIPSGGRPPWKEHGTRQSDRKLHHTLFGKNLGSGSHTGSDIIHPLPPWTDNRYENITFPQLIWQAVTMKKMCFHVITVSLNLSDFKALWMLCWKLGNRAIQSTKCVTCFWFSKDSSTAWLLGVVSDNFSYWFANCIPWTHHINQVILLIFDFCNNSFHFIN